MHLYKYDSLGRSKIWFGRWWYNNLQGPRGEHRAGSFRSDRQQSLHTYLRAKSSSGTASPTGMTPLKNLFSGGRGQVNQGRGWGESRQDCGDTSIEPRNTFNRQLWYWRLPCIFPYAPTWYLRLWTGHAFFVLHQWRDVNVKNPSVKKVFVK